MAEGCGMTENEAIKYLEFLKTRIYTNSYNYQCVDIAIKALEEIKQYRALGAVEELRESMEKLILKKPYIWGDGYDNEGEIIYDMYDCPNCGKSYEIDYDKSDYCPNCGQAIDWRDDK